MPARRRISDRLMPEVSSVPSTPPAGYLEPFAKNDHHLWAVDPTGAAVDLTAAGVLALGQLMAMGE